MTKQVEKIIFISVYLYVAIRTCIAFQQVASGTGNFFNQYSALWGGAFLFVVFLSVFIYIIIYLFLWKPSSLELTLQNLVNVREKLGLLKWFIAFIIIIFPGWFLQYTAWGIVFHDIYFRIFLWGIILISSTVFLSKGTSLLNWNAFISAVILTSAEFVILQALLNVTDYPFSLGWSEGNRMWDYSMMFGREIYDYPADKPVYVLLDVGRQFIGGLPFLFGNISIIFERIWIGITIFMPYVLLGIITFRFMKSSLIKWLLASLWVLLFLKQGPIHPPLIVSATIVALLWRSPLWLAIPLITLTGYLTEESRFTWLFAPGMWIIMLELTDTESDNISKQVWIRASILGLMGIAGGYLGDKVIGLLQGNTEATVAITVGSITSSVEVQPLLWYRLLPNATYGNGILLGLMVAILPLILYICYLIYEKHIKFNAWQSFYITTSLGAFFVVGVIVSTKIGGGGDLHNMDMFLIGLMFLSAIILKRIKNFIVFENSIYIKTVFVLILLIPGIQPLSSLRTKEYAGNPQWLLTLTDTKFVKDLEILPTQEIIDESLQIIRTEIEIAKQQGEILFIDQRQLLTFDYISDVPFVPEYEKKILMNEALSSSMLYFEPFYKDLQKKRFSLIISEPLRTPIKDETFGFGEENNAWVTWVSTPLLCFYEEKVLLKEVGVQLLIPRDVDVYCTTQLP